eukprot:3058743-Prymnesium_polylepis.1
MDRVRRRTRHRRARWRPRVVACPTESPAETGALATGTARKCDMTGMCHERTDRRSCVAVSTHSRTGVRAYRGVLEHYKEEFLICDRICERKSKWRNRAPKL